MDVPVFYVTDSGDYVEKLPESDSTSSNESSEIETIGLRRRHVSLAPPDEKLETGDRFVRAIPLYSISKMVGAPRAPKAASRVTKKRKRSERRKRPKPTYTAKKLSLPKLPRFKKSSTADGEGNKKQSVFWNVVESDKEPSIATMCHFDVKDAIIHIIFFLITALLVYGSSIRSHNYYSNVLTRVFTTDRFKALETTSSFKQIRRQSDVWRYLNNVVLKVLYGEDSNKILGENVLIGRPRLRQVRTLSGTCPSVVRLFDFLFTTCYDHHHHAIEDKRSFGLKTSAWTHKNDENTISFKATAATYGGGGFMYTFDHDLKSTTDGLKELEENMWIRMGTGAVFLDFCIFSPNAGSFYVIKLVFEILPTGGVLPHWRARSYRLFKYVWDYFLVGCHAVFAIFIMYYVMQIVMRIIYLKWFFLSSYWSIVDITIVIAGVLCVAFGAIVHSDLVDVADRWKDLANSKEYVAFDGTITKHSRFHTARSIIFYLAMIKTFKFSSIFRPTALITSTISCIHRELIVITFCKLLFFAASAFVGSYCFGSGVYQFRNFWESMSTMITLLYSGMYFLKRCEIVAPVATKVVFSLYIISLWGIFISMYIALIVLGYQRAFLKIDDSLTVKYIDDACSNLMFKLLRSIAGRRIAEKYKRVRAAQLNRGYRAALETMAIRYDFRGLNLALLMKKHDLRPNGRLDFPNVQNFYQEIHLRNQLFLEVVDHDKITHQLTKVTKSLDFIDVSISDILSKVDFLVNKVLTAK